MIGAKLQTSIYNECYKCKRKILMSKRNMCEKCDVGNVIEDNANALDRTAMLDLPMVVENNVQMRSEGMNIQGEQEDKTNEDKQNGYLRIFSVNVNGMRPDNDLKINDMVKGCKKSKIDVALFQETNCKWNTYTMST